jgi:hypothetical protein
MPAMWYGIRLSLGSGERASSHHSGSRAVVGVGHRRRSIIRSITHAPDQTVSRPRWLHWLGSTSPLPPPFSRSQFSLPFAGQGPRANQYRKASRVVSQSSSETTLAVMPERGSRVRVQPEGCRPTALEKGLFSATLHANRLAAERLPQSCPLGASDFRAADNLADDRDAKMVRW